MSDSNAPNVSYHRSRSNVPLDDQGIENDHALERITDFINEIRHGELLIQIELLDHLYDQITADD